MSQHTYARALTIATELGASEEQARDLFARLHAAGIHLVSIDPSPEPYTGERANPATREQAYAEAKAAIAEAKLRNTTVTPDQEEA